MYSEYNNGPYWGKIAAILGLVASLFVLGTCYAEAQTIVYDDGTTYEVAEDEKVVVVPADTPATLIAIEVVKLVDPEPVDTDCGDEDELVLGPTPPCES